MSKNRKKLKRVKNGLFSFFKKKITSLKNFLPEKAKRWILAIFMFLPALIFLLSFFNMAGRGGEFFRITFENWLGKGIFFLPLIFIISAISFMTIEREYFWVIGFSDFLFVLGITTALGVINPDFQWGGIIGEAISRPVVRLFGPVVAETLSCTVIFLSGLIFWQIFSPFFFLTGEREKEKTDISLLRKVVGSFPKFKISKIEPGFGKEKTEEKITEKPVEMPEKEKRTGVIFSPPPLELLEEEKEKAQAGDIQQNSFLIIKTLSNFGIETTVTEVSIGPTVTQYALKPAEGVKLSKITGLTNNLALALAAHPIRIEAPIPGKSLIGIEVPNKIRSKVRLRNLISHSDFKKNGSSLVFSLGKDVAGGPVFVDLDRCPHLLVAGATGTGKTIFLNSLILSFLYRNGIDTLRFILIDPKRVEFPVYNDLPHLLCPVIFDSQRAVNSLKWLVGEMERRFDVLSEMKTKNIASYNEESLKRKIEPLPYIVLIIDELADLMAARGKEIETGIVRLAQMARAVGIHLVVATQRPSVEVLTGLIKANITSRIAFQVASQFDSRTILDGGGAEKLLGSGDMLYLSAETIKPKRIQGAYASEQEVRKVVEWTNSEFSGQISKNKEMENHLAEDLEKTLEIPETELEDSYFKDDALYEEAKRVVIESRKASASLLQRRLGIGYARAARLLDMLEEKGIVGPAQGAKPREVYLQTEETDDFEG